MPTFGRTLIIWRFLLFFSWWHLTNGESHPQNESDSDGVLKALGISPTFGEGVYNGKKCDAKTKCNAKDGFVCVNGMCSCEFEKHQHLSSENKCVSLVHGPCLSSKNVSLPCTPNAKCVKDLKSYNNHKCMCVDGYIESSQRTCELEYGQPCGEELSQICDQTGELACVEGTCKCRDAHQVFDVKEKKCMGILGAVCSFIGENCGYGTSCNEVFRDQILKGMCTCEDETNWDGNECLPAVDL